MTDAEKLAALGRALVEAEQRLARIGELELELREVTTSYDAALARAAAERDAARTERDDLRRVLAAVHSSMSWRLTGPLRALKRR